MSATSVFHPPIIEQKRRKAKQKGTWKMDKASTTMAWKKDLRWVKYENWVFGF